MKKMVKKVVAIGLMVSLGTSLAPQDVLSAASVKKLTLSVTKASLTVGDSLTLKATVSPKKATVKWSSSAKKIAKVSSKGVVKALAAGKATITVKAGKKKATCKVTVKEADKGLDIHADDQRVTDSEDWVKSLASAKDENVKQMVVIAGMGMDKTTATLTMHERDEKGNWKQVLTTPAYVGKYGLCLDAERVEGNGRTPLGTYRFTKAFGIADDPGCKFDYVKVDNDTYWSGDDKYHYNEMVDIKDYPALNTDDSEHLIEYEYEYQYCLNIGFNEAGTPGRGSAIFLHCIGLKKPYTGGCVAVPEYIMKQIMQRVTPECVVVIDTLKNMTGDDYY